MKDIFFVLMIFMVFFSFLPTLQCQSDWVGDGNCDPACEVEACRYDLLDCKGCPCTQTLLTNGRCDRACNSEQCDFDAVSIMNHKKTHTYT